jgi:hypothetical protein
MTAEITSTQAPRPGRRVTVSSPALAMVARAGDTRGVRQARRDRWVRTAPGQVRPAVGHGQQRRGRPAVTTSIARAPSADAAKASR